MSKLRRVVFVLFLNLAKKRIKHAGLALHATQKEEPGSTAHKSLIYDENERCGDEPDEEAKGDVDAVEDEDGDVAVVGLLLEVGHVQLFINL
jgi:hypothetical protein